MPQIIGNEYIILAYTNKQNYDNATLNWLLLVTKTLIWGTKINKIGIKKLKIKYWKLMHSFFKMSESLCWGTTINKIGIRKLKIKNWKLIVF